MIPIYLDNLEKTLSIIQEKLTSLEDKDSYRIMFICDEILSNLLRHANFLDKTPDASCEIILKNSISLVFKDNAKEFNILDYPDPDTTLDIDERSLGGLGIYLSKKYAKNISYRYENGYNILEIEL